MPYVGLGVVTRDIDGTRRSCHTSTSCQSRVMMEHIVVCQMKVFTSVMLWSVKNIKRILVSWAEKKNVRAQVVSKSRKMNCRPQ